MNTRQHAQEIDHNTELIKSLYHQQERTEEKEEARKLLISELHVLDHALEIIGNTTVQNAKAETIARQFEIVNNLSNLFIELNKLLIQNS